MSLVMRKPAFCICENIEDRFSQNEAHIVSDEFEIRPVPSMECGVSCLDQLKIFYFKAIQNILMTCWLSGERSLPFGLLVSLCGVMPLHKDENGIL